MRDLFKKSTTIALIAGAALAVTACGKTETTNTTENTSMTDMNAMAPTEGTMNDMAATDMGNTSNGSEMMGDNSSSMGATDNGSSMMGSNTTNTQ